MIRREFVKKSVVTGIGAGIGLSGLSGISRAIAGEKNKPSKKTSDLTVSDSKMTQAFIRFHQATMECLSAGDLCIAHCQERLSAGETEFANCMEAVQQMVVLSTAASKLASLKARRLKDLLDVAEASAQACLEACQEHKEHWAHGMHLECKKCAECCQHWITACKEMKKNFS